MVDTARLGFLLVLLGAVLVLVSVLIAITAIALGGIGGGVSGGGCVIIFFIPVCFGAGEPAMPLTIASMVIALVLVVVSFVMLRSIRGGSGLGAEEQV